MSDDRDRLEQERRRFVMGHDSFQDLERRRDRQRRNRRLTSGVVALMIAVVGVGAAVYALRPTDGASPGNPSPSTNPSVSSPGPTPTSPQNTTPAPPQADAVAAPSGPIQFVDDVRGWMVDPKDGRILVTTDGGHSWDVQLSGPSSVQAIDMLDDQVGWALFEGGLLRTTDGGRHWDTWSNQSLTTAQFLSSDVGWGVEPLPNQSVGRLMKSEDGGETWTEQQLEVDAVCFSGDGTGWAAGPSEGGISVFRTDDGGANWAEAGAGLEGGDTVGYAAALGCGQSEAWIVATGSAGAGHIAWAVFRTTGGGPQSQPVLQDAFTHPVGQDGGVPEASNPQPGPMAVVDELTARLITWCPPCGGADMPYVSLERTGDAGATWTDPTIVDASSPGEPLGISFPDPDHGWVLLRDLQDSTAVVLKTSDGGQTWVEA
jgi:photosystem II stability/assembly factor-like uncharacterized protein